MVIEEDIKARKTLRVKILKELYELYCENDKNSTTSKMIDTTKIGEKEMLAYVYLDAMEFIESKKAGVDKRSYKITIYGIDKIENLIERNTTNYVIKNKSR